MRSCEITSVFKQKKRFRYFTNTTFSGWWQIECILSNVAFWFLCHKNNLSFFIFCLVQMSENKLKLTCAEFLTLPKVFNIKQKFKDLLMRQNNFINKLYLETFLKFTLCSLLWEEEICGGCWLIRSIIIPLPVSCA